MLQGLREVEIATIMRQVLEGLAYLHSRGVIHRDIKVTAQAPVSIDQAPSCPYLWKQGDVLYSGKQGRRQERHFSFGRAHSSFILNELSDWTHLQASNILVGRDGSVKLSDLGVAAKLERQFSCPAEGFAKLERRNTFVGSPAFIAPELLVGHEKGYGPSQEVVTTSLTLNHLSVLQC